MTEVNIVVAWGICVSDREWWEVLLCEQSYIPDIESWFHICDHTVKINEPVHFKGFLKNVLLLMKIFFLNNVLHTSLEGSLAHSMFII